MSTSRGDLGVGQLRRAARRRRSPAWIRRAASTWRAIGGASAGCCATGLRPRRLDLRARRGPRADDVGSDGEVVQRPVLLLAERPQRVDDPADPEGDVADDDLQQHVADERGLPRRSARRCRAHADAGGLLAERLAVELPVAGHQPADVRAGEPRTTPRSHPQPRVRSRPPRDDVEEDPRHDQRDERQPPRRSPRRAAERRARDDHSARGLNRLISSFQPYPAPRHDTLVVDKAAGRAAGASSAICTIASAPCSTVWARGGR